MSYDLSGITASNGKPKGRFTLRVLEAKIKKSRAGEDMFSIKFCITGKEFNKFTMSDLFMLQGKGAEFAMPKCAYLMDMLEIPRDSLANTQVFLNKLIDAEVGQDKEGYTKVKEYFKATPQDSGEDF